MLRPGVYLGETAAPQADSFGIHVCHGERHVVQAGTAAREPGADHRVVPYRGDYLHHRLVLAGLLPELARHTIAVRDSGVVGVHPECGQETPDARRVFGDDAHVIETQDHNGSIRVKRR